MHEQTNTRILGLDIIRSLAILFVISGHFFLNTPFKSSAFEGASMFFQSIAKTFFGIGVPLFIMLTGYLNFKKEASRKYYKSGIRVIISYILFSIITIFFRKYYLNDSYTWLQWGHKILDFSAIPYAWYIEMWIGLFLLTPFLNILYRGIPSKEQKQLLIGILYLLTAVPEFLNRYGLHLVPDYWQICYPLMFFFIGLYVNEYKPVVNGKIAWMVILGICLINPFFNLLIPSSHTLIHITGGTYGTFGTIIACLFFLIMYQKDIKLPALRSSITKVSLLSLDMYLCSYIFDACVYPYFIKHHFVNQSQFGWYFFIIVPIIFCSSFVLSWIVDGIKERITLRKWVLSAYAIRVKS